MELKKLPRVGSAFFTSGSGGTGSSTGSVTGSGFGTVTVFCLGTARFTGATLAGDFAGVFFVVAIQQSYYLSCLESSLSKIWRRMSLISLMSAL